MCNVNLCTGLQLRPFFLLVGDVLIAQFPQKHLIAKLFLLLVCMCKHNFPIFHMSRRYADLSVRDSADGDLSIHINLSSQQNNPQLLKA